MAKQKRIPGTQSQVFPALTAAATDYRKVRDARMEMGREEVRLKATLLELMKGAKLETYIDDEADVRVEVTDKHTTDLKVKKASAEPKGDDDE